MIHIEADVSRSGHLRLEVEGHADGAENGRVCAAVSAITQTAVLGLEEVARQHPSHVTITIKETP